MTKQFQIQLDEEDRDLLDQLARIAKLPRAMVLRQLIREAAAIRGLMNTTPAANTSRPNGDSALPN